MEKRIDTSAGLSLETLAVIGKRWQSVDANRALGGIRSASGFQYQFDFLLSVVCEAFTKEIEAGGMPNPEQSISSELLSDILQADSDAGHAYVIQVKRTTRAGQLRSAFDEFATVARFVHTDFPDYLASLRFRVATQTCVVRDADSLIRKWLGRVSGFPKPVRDALATISVEEVPDPTDTVAAFLVNRHACAEPYDKLSLLRGIIIGDAANPSQALSKVWTQLAAIRANAGVSSAPAYWVGQSDVAPESVAPGEVLVGRKPRFTDLRRGSFAYRPQYETLASQFLDFVERVAGEVSKQPVFWIEGRSGTGKSIALIHLLSHVRQTQDVDVMYLQGASGLPEALEAALKGTKGGRQVVVGVDDPYAPGETGLEAWDRTLAVTSFLQDTGEYSSYPIIICCGPTEQRTRLQSKFLEEASVEPWALPNAATEDMESLRGWYAARTGRLAPEIEGENILLVQLFFEWRMQQKMPEFATRLRERLKALGPKAFDVVARALSANRLYLDYPTRGLADLHLTPEEIDSLKILLRQHHMEPSFAEGEHVRISHPHLANAIYDVWFPGDGSAEETRAAHLTGLLSSYVDSETQPAEQMAPIWGLCHNLRSSDASAVRSRLTEGELRRALCDAYEQVVQRNRPETDILAILPAWVELSALLRSLRLTPAPAVKAMGLLHDCRKPCRGMRLVCHKLLESQEALGITSDVTGSLTAVLRRFPDWHEWPYVAGDLLRRTPGSDETLKLCSAWLRTQKRATHSMAQLLTDLLMVRPGNRHVVSLVLASPCMRSRYEARLVTAACRHSPRAASELFDAWMRAHSQERSAARTLGAGVLAGLPGAVCAAEQWCERWYREENATWVLEPLLDLGPDQEAYRKWSLAWLSEHRGASASYLLERLLVQSGTDRETLGAAFAWLERESPELPHWLPVWLTASRQAGASSTLVHIGVDGLRDAPTTTRRWAPAWRRLWQLSHGDPSLIDLAVEKLSTVQALQNNRAWLRAWFSVFRSTSADRRVTDLGIQWLNARLTTRRWAMTWTAIADARGEDAEVIDCAIRWLAHNTRTWRVWAAVWLRCHKSTTNPDHRDRLAAAGTEWLPNVPPEEIPSWSIIWQKVAKEAGITKDIADAATRWLEIRENWMRGDWEKDWSLLWKHDHTPALRDLALAWLDAGIDRFGAWPTVWRLVWAENASVDLSNLALQWLRDPGHFKHGSWVRILRDIAEKQTAPADIAAIGLPWLKNTPSYSNWWGNVWITTAGCVKPLSEDLIKLGNTWLTRSPPSSNSWGKVASILVSDGVLHSSVPERLFGFLEENPKAHQWGSLWRTLCSMPDAVAPIQLGRRWLSAALRRQLGNSTWHMVWQDLMEEHSDAPDERLQELAMQWLSVAPAKVTPWPNVWIQLWELRASPELRKLGERWLNKGFDGNPTYDRVVAALRERE